MQSNVIKIGNKIELVDKVMEDGEIRKRTYHSQICDMEDESNITVLIPVYEGKLIPLPVDKEFESYIEHGAGFHTCKVVVRSRFKTGNIYMMKVEIVSEVKKVQRREFFRLDSGESFLYKKITDAEREYFLATALEAEATRAGETISGVMLDISGGGIRYITKERSERGKYVLVYVNIEYSNKRKVIKTIGRVLSSETMPNRTGFYEERIQFDNITKSDREDIIRYIFEVERKRRQKERG